jgi:hypothetical protein
MLVVIIDNEVSISLSVFGNEIWCSHGGEDVDAGRLGLVGWCHI